MKNKLLKDVEKDISFFIDNSKIFIKTYKILDKDVQPNPHIRYDLIYVKNKKIPASTIKNWFSVLDIGGMICGTGYTVSTKAFLQVFLAFRRKPDLVSGDLWAFFRNEDMDLDQLIEDQKSNLMEEEFVDLVKGKSVIFVGPSTIISDLERGEEIDSYDLVIRTGNMINALANSRQLERDYGKRTDILYVNKIYEQTGCQRWWDLSTWIDRGLEFVCRKLPTAFPFKGSIRYRNFNTDITNLNEGKPFNPLMGILLINDLLRFPIKSLYVTGIDGFLPVKEEDRMSYSKGYVNSYIIKESQMKSHPLIPNAKVMLELGDFEKCTLDPICKESIEKLVKQNE